jgi:hypothetical protein
MDDEDYLSDGGGEFEDLDFEAEKNDEYNEMGRQAEYRSKAFEEIVENFEEAVSHIEEAVPLLQYFLYLFCVLNSLCKWEKKRNCWKLGFQIVRALPKRLEYRWKVRETLVLGMKKWSVQFAWTLFL